MSRRLLIIDRDERDRFVLAVRDGTLTIGASSTDAEIVLRDLHIRRLHCEVEVDEDCVLADSANGRGAPQELRPGSILHAGLTHLHFLPGDAPITAQVAAAPPDENVPELALEDPSEAPVNDSGPDEAETRLHFRFIVIDGADKGRIYGIPDSGLATVGKSHKHADIVLNDLYVSRVHCDLRVEGNYLVVRHVEGQSGTVVNGRQVKEGELYPGGILRVGNSHLKLETVDEAQCAASHAPILPVDDSETFAVAGDSAESEFQIVEDETEQSSAETRDDAAKLTDDSFVLPHAPVDPLLELEGQSFGHFKIEKLLGRGQSGLVFHALDHKSGHTVALKVLAADFPASEAELTRFVKAVKLASTLHHPALVSVHGAGKSGSYCWLSREYVEGESLSRRVRRIHEGGKADWKAACRTTFRVATLLDFLHRHNVAHGNITPRNILIRSSDQLPKLADLMLNRALEGSKLEKSILAGKLLAELPFMAPEQTVPQAGRTPLGDIYSLGAVFYAALTGQPPFAGENCKAIISQIHSAKVAPPSRLQRGIPPLLDTTVLMMMARRPEERFQSAADLISALDSFAAKHDVQLTPPASPEKKK